MVKSNTVMIAATKPKKPKTASRHPKVSVMVNNAISTLNERGGSSTQAIKKYIASYYKVNSDKLSPYIKRYLRNSVASGTLIQTKGTGASGSFKLAQETSSKSKFAVSKAKKPSKSVAATKLTKSKIPKKISPREKHAVIKSKNPKKSNAIKSQAPKSKENVKTKKIGGIMRIDGTKAPSSSYVR